MAEFISKRKKRRDQFLLNSSNFCYKVSEDASLLPDYNQAYFQFVLEGLTIINDQVYKDSHIRSISLLAEKFCAEKSMVEAISVEEYKAVPDNYLEKEQESE